MAGAVIGKGGHNIQKLRTEVCIDKFTVLFRYHFLRKAPIKIPQYPHPHEILAMKVEKQRDFKNVYFNFLIQ